jgi:hypothetical protein
VDDDSECIHGLTLRTCSSCKGGANRQIVYVTAGGQAWHLDRDCEARESGQTWVDEHGGARAPIETRLLSEVQHEREPCLVCVGGRRMGTGRPGIRSRSRDIDLREPKPFAASEAQAAAVLVREGATPETARLWLSLGLDLAVIRRLIERGCTPDATAVRLQSGLSVGELLIAQPQ